jgi:hypothetical protein
MREGKPKRTMSGRRRLWEDVSRRKRHTFTSTNTRAFPLPKHTTLPHLLSSSRPSTFLLASGSNATPPFPRHLHTQQSRRYGNILPMGAAEGGCSSATGFGRRGQGDDRVRRIDGDNMGRNIDEALDEVAVWKVYVDADRTIRLFLSICRVWPRRVHAGPRALSCAIPRD